MAYPLAALGVQVPQVEDPMQAYARAQALKSLIGQQQIQQQQVQQAGIQTQMMQQQQKDQQIWTQALLQSGGDPDKASNIAMQSGASGQSVFQHQQAVLAYREGLAKLAKSDSDVETAKFENIGRQNNLVANAIDAVKSSKDPANEYTNQLANLQRQGIDVSGFAPQYDPDRLAIQEVAVKGMQKLHQEAKEQAAAAAEQSEASIKQSEAQAMQQYGGLTQASADAKYRFLAAKQSQGQELSADDQAFMAGYKAQKSVVPQLKAQFSVNANSGARQDARTDKSYQYNDSQITKLETPLDQLGARLGRLKETLAQATPQADALAAPELLTVMAGGQGSGLRMNEAEIQRIVGGRSHWENLKAALQKWSTDPTHANSLTPDQRQQMQSLVNAVGSKLQAKSDILAQAHQDLINAGDVDEHRRIVANVRNKLNQIDSGSNTAGNQVSQGKPVYHMGKLIGHQTDEQAKRGTMTPVGQ